MFRTFVASLLVVAALGAPHEQSTETTRVLVVDHIGEVRTLFPGATLTRLARNTQTRGVTTYTLGNRLNGDGLVSSSSGNYVWPDSQNVELRSQYPASGQGAILSHVSIVVNTSSNIGQAYVVAGGIGQRFVVIIVEAKSTTWFDYNTYYYGV